MIVLEWFVDHVMAPLFLTAAVLLVVGLIVVGAYFGGKFVLGLGHDQHGQDYGTIVSKAYTPNTLQTSPVPVATGNGMVMGVVTTGTSEKYDVLIRMGDRVYSFESRELWALGGIGDRVIVHYRTNPQWDLEIESADFTPRR